LTRFRILIAGLAVLTALAAGCGDDDDDGGEALSEADFITQADAICAAADAELDEASSEAFTEEPSPEDMESFIDDTVAPNLRAQFEDIRALNGPDDFEADVDALLDDAEAAIDDMAALSGDDVMAMFETGEDPFEDIDARAEELGFSECGGGDDS
jgi:hypothetical protein